MKLLARLRGRERKHYVLSCCIFLLLSLNASSQSSSPAYRLWEHPAIKAMERHDPNMVIYARSPDFLVNLCIVDKLTGLACYVSQYGYIVDTLRLATAQRKQLQTAPYKVNPFHLYEASVVAFFPLVEKAKEFLRLNGDDVKKASPVLQEFFAFAPIREAPSTLAKLLVIQEYEMEYASRLLDFTGIRVMQQVNLQGGMDAGEKAGSLFIRGTDSGYSEYINKELLFAIRKARLEHATGRITMYDWKDRPVDSFFIRKSSLKTLLDEKTDVFALYRAWLEWKLQQLNAVIPGWQYAASYELLKEKKGFIYSGLFNQKSSRTIIHRLLQEKEQVLDKIDSLSAMDPLLYTDMIAYPRYRRFKEVREWDGQHWKIIPSGLYVNSETYTSTRGWKFYELTDHRGNVVATVTDKKIGIDDDGDGRIDRYVADIAYVTDYYPGGMLMPGRHFSSGSYRYGFNGKESDNEAKGDGNQYDYGMRIYDPRVVRFLSVDPLFKGYPYYTPYQFAGNSPIWAIDLDGLEDYVVVKELYKNGATRKISIQYTTKKSDVNSTINMQFKQLLGKNPDGSDKLGESLTDQKVVRIIKDANKKEKVEYPSDLSKEEKAIKNQFSRNEMGNPTDDAWKLTVNGEKYTSGIDRDESTQQDKIAQRRFPLITNLNQTLKNGAVPFYLPNDGTGELANKIPNKYLNAEEVKFFNLPSMIKEDGGIKSITINYTLYLSPSITPEEMVGVNKSLENVKNQILALYGTSATGVKNVTVNMQTTQTSDFQSKNAANPDPVKVILTR